MRPKIAILILLMGVVAITGILLIKHPVADSAPVLPSPLAAAQPQPSPVEASPNRFPTPPAAATAGQTEATKTVLTEDQREAAIDAETGRLLQWAMMDDAASLSNILADLTSPEAEIRAAAIVAAEQFDSTNAIPALRAVADVTTNAVELAALWEAIKFISLPNLFEGSPPHQRAKPAGAQ